MNRSCTDVVVLIIFLVFIVVLMAVSGWAVKTGDPMNIIVAYDSDGNRCGMPEQKESIGQGTRDFTEYKYKYFTQVL